jgi:hypothetical protein
VRRSGCAQLSLRLRVTRDMKPLATSTAHLHLTTLGSSLEPIRSQPWANRRAVLFHMALVQFARLGRTCCTFGSSLRLKAHHLVAGLHPPPPCPGTRLPAPPSPCCCCQIVGALHHGKTTLMDMLVEQTHDVASLGIRTKGKPLRFTDTRLDEQVGEATQGTAHAAPLAQPHTAMGLHAYACCPPTPLHGTLLERTAPRGTQQQQQQQQQEADPPPSWTLFVTRREAFPSRLCP